MKAIGRVILWSLGGLIPFALLVALEAMPPYIPDHALAAAARARDAATARDAMFAVLRDCSRLHGYRSDDVGTRLSTLHSLENDSGLFATTTMRCEAGRCTVAATALIPHAARPDTCWRRAGQSWGDRRWGFGDWAPR